MPLARKKENAGGAVWRRVQWLDHEIRVGNHPTKQQLRDRFGIAESCATQTIAFMQGPLGLPLEYDRSKPGYVYCGPAPPLPVDQSGLLVSREELTALRLVSCLATRYLDVETCNDLNSLAEHILSAAGQELVTEHRRWESDVVFTGPPPLRRSHLRAVKAAIESSRVLLLDYRAPGHEDLLTREVEPHFLVNAGGDWLLVGWDRERDAPRTFALARIEGCPTTSEEFQRRAALEANSFTRHQFLSEGGLDCYDLVVRFDTQAGRVAGERKWHPTQQVRTAEDGRLELTLTVSGTGDVLRWLLSFGGGAEVILPEKMRQMLHEKSRAAAELNRTGS